MRSRPLRLIAITVRHRPSLPRVGAVSARRIHPRPGRSPSAGATRLWALSRQYHVGLNQLASANGMRLQDILPIGRNLAVPSPTPTVAVASASGTKTASKATSSKASASKARPQGRLPPSPRPLRRQPRRLLRRPRRQRRVSLPRAAAAPAASAAEAAGAHTPPPSWPR